MTFKLPPRLTISTSLTQTFARLPEADFTARILSSQVNYAASPFLAFSNLIQYDNRSRNLSWQSRMRWTMQPGNDLFFIVNQGWIHDLNDRGFRFSPEDTQLSTKVQYTFRLSRLDARCPAKSGSFDTCIRRDQSRRDEAEALVKRPRCGHSQKVCNSRCHQAHS